MTISKLSPDGKESLSIKETSQAHLYLALLMSRLDNNGESLNYFTKAINLNSFWGNDLKISDAYYRRGLLNYKLKNKERQIDIFLHPELIEYINENIKVFKNNFLWKNFLLVNIKPDKNLFRHQFKMYSPKKKQYIDHEQF